MAPLRVGATVGFQRFGCGKNSDLKAKAKVELQLMVETDADNRVKQAARQALARINNTGLLLEADEIEFAGEQTKSVKVTSGKAQRVDISGGVARVVGLKAGLKDGTIFFEAGGPAAGASYVTVAGKDERGNDATFLLKVFVNHR